MTDDLQLVCDDDDKFKLATFFQPKRLNSKKVWVTPP